MNFNAFLLFFHTTTSRKWLREPNLIDHLNSLTSYPFTSLLGLKNLCIISLKIQDSVVLIGRGVHHISS